MYGASTTLSASGSSVIITGVYYGAEILTFVGIILVAAATVLLARPEKAIKP